MPFATWRMTGPDNVDGAVRLIVCATWRSNLLPAPSRNRLFMATDVGRASSRDVDGPLTRASFQS